MKLFALFVTASAGWVAASAMIAQAATPQPVIQLPQRQRAESPEAQTNTKEASRNAGHRPCLGDGTGFVRARVRGALNVDVNWKDAQLECSGEERPDGSGLRVSFAGPGPNGRIIRMVFGMRSAKEGTPGRELPTNFTLVMDGGRVFATQGDDKCTMDQMSQLKLPATGPFRSWRIEARGFCIAPANAVAGEGRIVVSRFDFAGRIEF